MSMRPWLPDHVKILHDAHVEHLKELRSVRRLIVHVSQYSGVPTAVTSARRSSYPCRPLLPVRLGRPNWMRQRFGSNA